jgi:hypothetical protein
LCERCVQVTANLLSLERTGGGENSYLLGDLQNVKLAPVVDVIHLECAEARVFPEKLGHLVLYHPDVCTHVIHGEANFDKLFLFHKLLIRAVVNNVFPKDGRGQML